MSPFRLSHRVLLPALVLACQFSLLTIGLADSNGLAATVNGRAITRSEVDEQIKPQLRAIDAQVTDPNQRGEIKTKLRKESLDALVDRELFLAEYSKLSQGQPIKPQYVDEDVKDYIKQNFGGDTDKFLKELKGAGLTLKKFREVREKTIILQMMRGHVTKEVGVPTPDKKEAFLKQHGDLFRGQDYIKLRSITVNKFGGANNNTPADQKKLVQEIRNRVLKGGDFANEAKLNSADSHASTGGDWGEPITRSAMSAGNPRLAEAAFSLNPKSISDVVEDEENYYLFYVEAKQPGKMKPKDEIEPELEKMVQAEEKTKVMKAWLERIRAKANIKRY